MSNMRRREFITLLGGTAIVWPFAAQLAAALENDLAPNSYPGAIRV